MDSIEEQQQEEDVMEVPGIDGELLVELLDASLAAEGARHNSHQLSFAADVIGDGWNSQSQELKSIHPHQEDCEDCGLDDILSDFEGCGCSPAPYVVNNDDPIEYWTEEIEAAAVGPFTGDCMGGPFTGDCMGECYMDGTITVTGWDDGRPPMVARVRDLHGATVRQPTGSELLACVKH